MKLWGALLTASVTVLAALSLFDASRVQALATFQNDYTYAPIANRPFGKIVDGAGKEFLSSATGSWGCNLNLTGASATYNPATQNTAGVYVCDNEPANFYYINDESGDRSFLVISGGVAQAEYASPADLGIPKATFYSFRGTTKIEQSFFVEIDNGGANGFSHPFTDIRYSPNGYQFLDDRYETLIDNTVQNRFTKIDGCVGQIGAEAGQILPASSSTCQNDGSIYFVYQSGSRVAAVRLFGNLPPEGTDIASAVLPNAGFVSYNGNLLIDRIQNAQVDSSGFFASEATSDFDTKCVQSIGVLAWIMCPLINFAVENIAAPIQDFILSLLETDSLLTAPATNNNSFYIYTAWSQFRTIANALLAVGFIVLIYLMLFSQNNNFSIQRTLPRLIVITVMIQISYFIAALIIDIGNITAEGIADIFNAVRQRAIVDAALLANGEPLQSAIPSSTSFLTDSTAARGVGAGFGVILAVFGFYLWTFFIPGVVFFFSIGLIVGILGVLVALVLRQLAIVVLVVLAPVAFIFGLFPSTEKWMREWFDNLGKLVLVYPLIALVFGAGSLLSYLSLGTGSVSAPNMLISSAIGLIVLFTIPVLLRFAGRIFSNFTAAITGMSSRAKTGLQGDAQDPLSWRSNVKWDRAQKQYLFYERVGKTAPYTRRFLRPSWKQAKIFNDGAQRMQGVVSATHPINLRRLYWGDKPFKSLAGYANWKSDHIKEAKPFNYEIKNITKSLPMLYSTLDAALQDTGFLFDRGLNYTYGIGRLYKDGEISKDEASLMWSAYHSRVKSQGHRPFFGFADPSTLLDYDYNDAADLGGKWFAKNINEISNAKEREAIFRARQSSLEDFGNAGTEREAGSSWRYVARWLNDESFLNEMINTPNNQRNINAIETLKRKADTMNVALNDPTKRAELIARMQQMGGDDDEDGARIGGYGQSGQGIRHMEEFVNAANKAYSFMLSRGVTFTDEINDFNF